MKYNRKSTYPAEVTPDIAERIRMIHELLPHLAHAMMANEKVQRKFRTAALIRLSQIETLATHIYGAQLAEAHLQTRKPLEQAEKMWSETEAHIKAQSGKMGLAMVNYIYGQSEETAIRHDRRRKWTDWMI